MDVAATLAQIVQAVAVIAGFVYTIRTIRQSNDARNTDFVLQAEGQIDPLFSSLMTEDAAVIRMVLPQLIPNGTLDVEVKTYAYTYFAYRHLSRIVYLLTNDSVSLGMSDKERDALLEDWLNETAKYNQETLRTIHGFSRTTGEFNDAFIALMDRRFPPPTGAE